MTTPRTAATIPSPGRESDRVQRARWLGCVMVVDFHIELEHLIQLEGAESGDGHAQRVAHEIADMVVIEGRWHFWKSPDSSLAPQRLPQEP